MIRPRALSTRRLASTARLGAEALAWGSFSADGALLFTASRDHIERLWDVASGRPVGSLQRSVGESRGVAFSPDHRRAVTVYDGGELTLWDTRDAAPLANVQGHLGTIRSLTFSPDGSRLATGSDDGTTRVWSLDPALLTGGRVGLAYGSTHGSSEAMEVFTRDLFSTYSLAGLQGTGYLKFMSHTCAANLAQYYGLRGRVVPTCAACVSGSLAVGAGYELVRSGAQDLALCGGASDAGTSDAGTSARYCADTRTDRLNCGACGTVCPAGQQCNATTFMCECAPRCPTTSPSTVACGTNIANVCPGGPSCGTGTGCPSGQTCSEGRCVCVPNCPPDAMCGQSNGCGGQCPGQCPVGRQCSRDPDDMRRYICAPAACPCAGRTRPLRRWTMPSPRATWTSRSGRRTRRRRCAPCARTARTSA